MIKTVSAEPGQSNLGLQPAHIFADAIASMVVFMVALPLCIAIAQASGVSSEAGILAGIIGGLIVGLLSGSPLQVSGPAAGLVVLVARLVDRFGAEGLAAAVALAGLIQIIAAILKIGNWFRAVSPAVIHGMLAGIGILIVASQFHVLLDDKPADSPIQNLLTIPNAALRAFNDHDQEFPHHRSAAIVGLSSILTILLWNAYRPRILKLIPGALAAVLVGSVIAWLIPQDIKNVVVSSNLLASIHWLPSSGGSVFARPDIWQAAASIALIASAETLLCASAIDRMHVGPRTQYNRELFAQGIGNALCGFVGALPVTGVIVRSAANVEAGAKTRWSAILHGLWLLLFVLFLPWLLEMIPTTSLAAILIVTGYRLIDFSGVRELWKTSRSEAAILAITALTIVGTDLLVGVMTGIVLAMLKLLWTFSHLKIHRRVEQGGQRTVLELDGAATFLRLPWLADELEKVPPSTELHVDFRHLTYVDHACLELLVNWEKQHEATGGSLVIDWDSLHARFKSPSHPSSNGKLDYASVTASKQSAPS